LAREYDDAYVAGFTVDPEADAYFTKFYNSLAAFQLSAGEVEERYADVLSYEPNLDPTGAMLFSADIMCVWGSSWRWAVWGERQVGAAVVHTVGGSLQWRKRSEFFVSADEALRSFVEPNYSRQSLTLQFRREFLRNFGQSV